MEAFDAATYYDLWHGDASLTGGGATTITRERWAKLVADVRSSGLDALSDGDRAALMQGVEKAYLLSVHATKRRLTADGIGTADVVETYATDPRAAAGGDLFIGPLAREQRSSEVESEWGDSVFEEAGEHHVIDTVEAGGREDVEWRTYTEGSNGEYSCTESNDSASLGIAALIYYGREVGLIGTRPVGHDRIYGRGAFIVERSGGPSTARIWLDAKSLFPVRFDYSAFVVGGRMLQPTVRVDVVAFNPDVEVTLPDVACEMS